jgi:predicted phosphodiesterase
MTVKLAVLSDLHCHPSPRRGAQQVSYLLTDALRLPAGNHPVQALLDLIEEQNLQAAVVLVPGDLADKVNREGMLTGWGAVKEIAGALRAELLATTLGNHDADSRAVHTADAFYAALHLGRDYPIADTEARRDFWADGFCILEHPAVRILVINSVAEHRSAALAARGSVTEEMLQNLERRLRSLDQHSIQVALVHHHPIAHEDLRLGSEDLMVNGSLLLNLLGQHGYRILVHGHKHHPRLMYYDAAGEPVLVFAAGSFAAISAQFFGGNLFHILELEDTALPEPGRSPMAKGGRRPILDHTGSLQRSGSAVNVTRWRLPHKLRTSFQKPRVASYDGLSSSARSPN